MMPSTPPAALTLKMNLDGEIRRFEACQADLASIRSAVAALFDLTPVEAQKLSLQYEDDEGDVCTLTDITLPDALSLAERSRRTLRLHSSRGGSHVHVATKAAVAVKASTRCTRVDEAEERQCHRMDGTVSAPLTREERHLEDRQATELDARQRQRLDGTIFMT
mmetsp:Transcript_113243/g.331017  ORF Transcript_113243/g.331017 Transcript_113243/m.331017 type:complete len:164 (-) Transcript_113243:126-617(-)